ncbi:glycine C-acetyltransferase [Candidatus Falkowbacteria bacterium RIFOXYC2_FULL_47_12]|uniref:Glycine C-acetyltransferase n=2 Tax=Candidatus Falkowiibacteriota TaxID=1752728 RepID=A0A1F5TRV1_9BACT|nr:MAG: glycine C-acetyltransferase [Candidatus Falkowbacteria bacterium RIFOXYA2_FULL_47_9]OGF41331.1 MAG: glycine C-acetyltransferase [Candidatus Falkowbacteria bacterium RIFOXYC2_FULL_47_12]
MYTEQLRSDITNDLQNLQAQGKYKTERLLTSAAGPEVELDGKKVLLFASNNYLGLANHPDIIAAAKEGMEKYGFGLSSVRFICGTQVLHRELEIKLAAFLGVEDAILYSTCFMANLGFFATLINEGFGSETYTDVIYSDALNHASIIDAFKLVKKERVEKRIYPHTDMAALETLLREDATKPFRFRFIVSDGIFSMEGDTAPLPELIELAQRYQALLFVDDAHATGVLGATGAGTPEHLGVHGKIDVLSGTFGKALGGAVGGYLAGKKEVIDLLRQKSRTYLFSNSLPPAVVTASLKALDILQKQPELLQKVKENSEYFRQKVKTLGFKTPDGQHPIVPVMLGDAALTQEMSKKLLAAGLYVVGLWFPVVPEGTARLRFQVSAAHTREQLDRALAILESVGKEMKLI